MSSRGGQPRFTLPVPSAGGDRPGMLCSFRIPGAWSCAWSLNIQANNCFSTGEPPLPPQVPRVKDLGAPKPLPRVPLPRTPVTLSVFSTSVRLVSASPGDQRGDRTPAVIWDQQ